ncbi:hypothetical protein MRX96_055579 [Rhipicephalus microplus]
MHRDRRWMAIGGGPQVVRLGTLRPAGEGEGTLAGNFRDVGRETVASEKRQVASSQGGRVQTGHCFPSRHGAGVFRPCRMANNPGISNLGAKQWLTVMGDSAPQG